MSKGDPLGFDAYVGPVPGGGVDLLPDGRGATGVELARNEIVARSMTDTIPMIGAPGGRRDFGRDVRAWVGSPLTEASRASRAQELAVVYARSPRLDTGSIRVIVDATPVGSRYNFAITVEARTTTAQPVSMVLGINAISVDIIAKQGS